MMCFIVLYNHMKKIVKSCFGENSKMTIFNKKETNKHLIHYYTGLRIFKKWGFFSFLIILFSEIVHNINKSLRAVLKLLRF